MTHFAIKCPKVIYVCQGLTRVIFKKEFLNLSYDSDSWQWSFKIEFFPFQKDIPIYSPVSYHRRAVGSIGKGW